MMTAHSIAITRVAPCHLSSLAQLFESTDKNCFCRYWHFHGSTNDWLMRCYQEKDRNKLEFEESLSKQHIDSLGVVAIENTMRAIGWLKLTPANEMPKLYMQRLYKNLPCFHARDAKKTMTIGCMLIHPDYRKRGLSEKLIRGAIELAVTLNMTHIEAFPRRSQEGLRDDDCWMGPASTLLRLGFKEVTDLFPYPVLRLDL